MGKPTPRKSDGLFKFPDPSGLSALEQFEQNWEFYEANIREVEKQYGGTLVRDKKLSGRILRTMQIEAMARGGQIGREIELGDFPAEQFIAVPIVFEVSAPGGATINAKKWYFIRRSKLFRGAH